jgi:N-acetylglucosamine-6-phosphate deacetylase
MPEVRCELIADNIHVHPAVMKILWAAKGVNGLILVSDAVRPAGLPEGEYAIDDRSITLKDGAVQLADGTLAGSILTLNTALRNFMEATGQPLETVWPVSSLNAARTIQVADRKGSLEVGKDADLVLVDKNVHVYLTVVEGQMVYRDEAGLACL